jgi:hypothetical protein
MIHLLDLCALWTMSQLLSYCRPTLSWVERDQRIIRIARGAVGGIVLLLFVIKGSAFAIGVGQTRLAQRIERHLLRVIADGLVHFAGLLMDQAEHVPRHVLPAVSLHSLLEIGRCRAEPACGILVDLQGGPVVVGPPPAEMRLRARGVECYGLIMFLDGQTEQPVVFIGGNQLECPAIASFLRIGPAPLCVRRRSPGGIASGLDGPRGIPDVAAITAQIQIPGHPVAAPQQKDKGGAQRHGHLQGCSHRSIPQRAEHSQRGP